MHILSTLQKEKKPNRKTLTSVALVPYLNQGMRMKTTAFLVVGFMVVVSVLVVLRREDARFMKPNQSHDHNKVLLHGLISPEFEQRYSSSSCNSRYESHLYRKHSTPPHKPSPYLISKLRNYEAVHKRCGPYTQPYYKAVAKLQRNETELLHHISSTDCTYVVWIWIPLSGLGNRILSLASAFLYALLTDRVLLVDPGNDMPDLFCDPFPQATWFLPSDFPLRDEFRRFNQRSPQRFGKMVKDNKFSFEVLKYVYVHLIHNYNNDDKRFFCDKDQKSVLEEVPWVIMKADNYFIPGLFLIPSFQQQLSNLFPKKDLVFHFLSMYLFHPSDEVWGLVTRYYNAHLGKADERVGIQVRVFGYNQGPYQHVVDQIVSCALKEKLLPGTETTSKSSVSGNSSTSRPKSKAVLVTSLSSWYSDKLREVYGEHPTKTGEEITFLQPSHEELQQTDQGTHNKKALAEMYMLSFSDVLITSALSTFGYVAQGLGGVKPWMLYLPQNQMAPDPPCQRDISMEPCFLAPPRYDCNIAERKVDARAAVSHVSSCEDNGSGLKLVDVEMNGTG